MEYCPFCGNKLKRIAPCVFICEHKFKEYPDQNMVLIFITNMESVSVHLLKEIS